MAEGVTVDDLARGLQLGDDRLYTGPLGEEDVHIPDLVEDLAQSFRLGSQIDLRLWYEHRVDVPRAAVETDVGQPLLLLHPLTVLPRGGSRQPTAVASHNLVDEKHPASTVVLGDHVLCEPCAHLGRGVGTERLPDRNDVVVDCLRKTDHGEWVLVLGKVGSQIGGSGVRVVTADGVEDVNPVGDQSVCRHLQGIRPLFDKAPLHEVLDVRQLHA